MSKPARNKKYPSHQLDTLVIRFPDGMKERIMSQAKEANRSANAHIIHLLQLAMDAADNGFGTEISAGGEQQLAGHAENRLTALENTVNQVAEDFARILGQLDDQALLSEKEYWEESGYFSDDDEATAVSKKLAKIKKRLGKIEGAD